MTSIRKIYGRRTVLEALRSQQAKVERLMLAKGTRGSILKELADEAQARGVPVEMMERRRMDKLFGHAVNQGVVALLQGHEFLDIHQLIKETGQRSRQPLILVADEIEDPRNLGAIARSAEGVGAQGLIMTYHRSAGITPITAKAAGGALEHLPICQVKSLNQAFETLKNAGYWIAGLDADTDLTIWQADLNRPLALVIGSEGKGLRRLTRETCDLLIKIPMQGKIESLNAAVAAGIALFEIRRQQATNSAQHF